MVAHRRLVRARPYAGPAQQSAHRGRIRGRRSAVRSSSCGGQVLSRQPLGQRPSLYVVCHVTWSAMLRGLSCYVVCDVAWSVMSRGLSCLGKPGWSSLAGSSQNRFGDGVEKPPAEARSACGRLASKSLPRHPAACSAGGEPRPLVRRALRHSGTGRRVDRDDSRRRLRCCRARRKQHQVDAAGVCPAFLGVIGVGRRVFRVARHGHAGRRNLKTIAHQLQHGDATRRGEIPIAVKSRGVDRPRVGVAYREVWMGRASVWPSSRTGLGSDCTTAAILARMGRLSGATVSSPEAKNAFSRMLMISPRASSLSCSLPFFRSESSPLCKVSSDLARSGGCVSGGLGGGALGFSRSVVFSLLQGPFRASCFPRPRTVEIAALNWPCSSACRTESDTSLALYLSFCVEANITTKKANSSVMKSA